MTIPAENFLEPLRVIFARILVAIRAIEVRVHRRREGLRVDVEQYGRTTTVDLELLVIVTHETGVVVRDRIRGDEGQTDHDRGEQKDRRAAEVWRTNHLHWLLRPEESGTQSPTHLSDLTALT